MTPDRIITGVDWLDRWYYGWRDNVDPATLDMTSLTMCVLGQMATGIAPYMPFSDRRYLGSYFNVVYPMMYPDPPWICLWRLDHHQAVAHGFQSHGETWKSEIVELQKLWVEELEVPGGNSTRHMDSDEPDSKPDAGLPAQRRGRGAI